KLPTLLTVLGCCLVAQSLFAAPGQKEGAAQKKATNVLVAEPEVPASVFVIPTEPKEGKDPFFPMSRRPYVRTMAHTMTNAPTQSVKLLLNGISRKLAMINGRTFSEGEEGDVNTDSGRRHIRCVKIREESAIVDILENGTAIDRQELKLRIF